MGSIFRSELMSLVQIIERNDAARDVVGELGALGLMQLRDLNAGTAYTKRAFSADARRVEEMRRRLENLQRQLALAKVAPTPRDGAESLEAFGEAVGKKAAMAEIDAEIREAEAEFVHARAQQLQVMHTANRVKEHLLVLALGSALLGSDDRRPAAVELTTKLGSGVEAPLLSNAVSPGAASTEEGLLNIVAGTIPRVRAATFARVVHRLARGNAIYTDDPIEEELLASATKEEMKQLERIPKNGFLIIFSGSVLKAKLLKIVSHFGARTYNYPETRNGRIASQVGLRVELEDLSLVIRHTASQLRAQHASLASRLALWRRTI